ncbi:MAG: hypothetical protein JWN68_2847 [Nocardioides sp.]|jgi:hypothetical protein|uniref:hypothetical protein n=1 Tax=Nocardioides sp. TaxID=35761 RepID=UPI00262F290E|nr:hypothetical protein [Nocardioides sp.]MCW2834894.1 hypothetical protein [Nocardioides sp.]
MTPTLSSRSRGVATLVLATAIALGATGCGDDAEPVDAAEPTSASPETPSDSSSPTETASPDDQVIDITIADGKVVPNGERVDAAVGEEVILRITSDAPDELHVHATPEQEVPIEVGTTEVPLTFDRPGVVEVELHELEVVLVQLEVR